MKTALEGKKKNNLHDSKETRYSKKNQSNVAASGRELLIEFTVKRNSFSKPR